MTDRTREIVGAVLGIIMLLTAIALAIAAARF